MKKLLLIIFVFSYFQGSSQAYDNLLSNESHWYVSYCGAFCITDHYYAKGDTTINGNVYTFLNKYHYNKNMMLREDTTQRKIFFISVGSNKETLLYDFGLLPGDSIEVKNPISPLPTNAGWYILDSIKLQPFLDGNHKVFYLSEKNGNNTTRWVEGMGSFSLINTPSSDRDLEGTGDLTCFYKDGIKIYQSDTLPTGECDTLLMVGTNSTTIIDNKFKLYPNPAFSYFTIEDNIQTINPTNVFIYNTMGELFYTTILNAFNTKVNCQNWPNGIYSINLIRGDKVFTKKLIIQK